MFAGLGVSVLLAAAPPCLPVELGLIEPRIEAPAPEVAPLPVPAAKVAPVPPRPAPSPVAQNERARYRIEYGPIPVGEIRVDVGAVAPGAKVVRASGEGGGAVLGLGRMRNSIASELDLERLDSRSWVNARENDDRALVDRGSQPEPGHVTGSRVRAAHPRDRVLLQATFGAPVLDPLAFLLRLRIAPPRSGDPPQILHVLDGQAFWRVTVRNAGRAPLPEGTVRAPTLRFDVAADPVNWDGSEDKDPDRHRRSFAIWISDDANRVPIRVEIPFGPSAIVVALTDIERRPR